MASRENCGTIKVGPRTQLEPFYDSDHWLRGILFKASCCLLYSEISKDGKSEKIGTKDAEPVESVLKSWSRNQVSTYSAFLVSTQFTSLLLNLSVITWKPMLFSNGISTHLRSNRFSYLISFCFNQNETIFINKYFNFYPLKMNLPLTIFFPFSIFLFTLTPSSIGHFFSSIKYYQLSWSGAIHFSAHRTNVQVLLTI